jgi:tRNA dimethylallyltransferase
VTRAEPRFLAITGTTASGKTDLSLALAERVELEIVSMDSRQLYRGMDIGTDKVGDAVRAAVPHHGLDLVDPDERYSAGRFARDARGWIAGIEARSALPVLVGGTGFFLKAVMEPIFAEPPLDRVRLERLRGWLGDRGPEELGRFVEALDPERAAIAVEGGPQRMSRTIEVALLTGVPLSRWHRDTPAEAAALHGLVVVLGVPRDEMDRRIDDRVSRMVERGLLEEVRRLYRGGYSDEDPGMTGTGYREVARHFRGEITLEEAMDEIRHNTRRYARRQLTWLRHQLPPSAVRVDATSPLDDQVEAVLRAISASGLVASPRSVPGTPAGDAPANPDEEAPRTGA